MSFVTNNKILFMNMIENKYFPNLLLYGPPGTGKTTTIITLINEYQVIKKKKSQVIHLLRRMKEALISFETKFINLGIPGSHWDRTGIARDVYGIPGTVYVVRSYRYDRYR